MGTEFEKLKSGDIFESEGSRFRKISGNFAINVYSYRIVVFYLQAIVYPVS